MIFHDATTISLLLTEAAIIISLALLLVNARKKLAPMNEAIAELKTQEQKSRAAEERSISALEDATKREARAAETKKQLAKQRREHTIAYGPIKEIEKAISKMRDEQDKLLENAQAERRKVLESIEFLSDEAALHAFGPYRNAYPTLTSKELKAKLDETRSNRKSMRCERIEAAKLTNWTVNESAAEGRKMVRRATVAMFDHYDALAEDAVAKCTYRNGKSKRDALFGTILRKAGKLGESIGLFLPWEYAEIWAEELDIIHAHHAAVQNEKEEMKAMKQAEREQARVLKEAEAAEREERRVATELNRLKALLGVDAKDEKIAKLEAQLVEAHAIAERARSMAEQTRMGHVYIISNPGSFGEGIVKIGLTRRIDPQDRVDELGDASVPFKFDVHAMVFSEDAVALERALHRRFCNERINRHNMRREFFAVTLDEVEVALSEIAPDAAFYKEDALSDYQKTITLAGDYREIVAA